MRDVRVEVFGRNSVWSEDLNRLYDFARRSWNRTWSELGIEQKQTSDDFRRMKAHAGFFVDNRPIAYAAYDLFEIGKKWDEEHTYFARLPSLVISELKRRSLFTLGTMEYFTVDPEFRKVSGHDIGEALGAFSTQYLKTWGADGLIALSRNDRGVGEMCRRFGGLPLVESLVSYGVPTSVMVFEHSKIEESERIHIRQFAREAIAGLHKSQTIFLQGAA